MIVAHVFNKGLFSNIPLCAHTVSIKAAHFAAMTCNIGYTTSNVELSAHFQPKNHVALPYFELHGNFSIVDDYGSSIADDDRSRLFFSFLLS